MAEIEIRENKIAVKILNPKKSSMAGTTAIKIKRHSKSNPYRSCSKNFDKVNEFLNIFYCCPGIGCPDRQSLVCFTSMSSYPKRFFL